MGTPADSLGTIWLEYAPRDGTFLGALFESSVTQSVRVYAQAADARVGHLRMFAGSVRST